MTTPIKKMPAPLYAAAGATDLAYQQLRKLPEKVAEFRGRVNELRPVVAEAVSERRRRVDLDRLRDVARRNATVLQERAVAVYGDLVARGERVVSGERVPSGEGGSRPPRPVGKLAKINEPAGLPSPSDRSETPPAPPAVG